MFINEMKAFFNENDHEAAYLHGAAANRELINLENVDAKCITYTHLQQQSPF